MRLTEVCAVKLIHLTVHETRNGKLQSSEVPNCLLTISLSSGPSTNICQGVVVEQCQHGRGQLAWEERRKACLTCFDRDVHQLLTFWGRERDQGLQTPSGTFVSSLCYSVVTLFPFKTHCEQDSLVKHCDIFWVSCVLLLKFPFLFLKHGTGGRHNKHGNGSNNSSRLNVPSSPLQRR